MIPAQTAATAPPHKDLKTAPAKVEETIVVTATRSERTLNDLPVSATVITAAEIRSAPVRSVDDLLRGVAGVQPSIVSSSGSTPTNQQVSMHGLGGTRALVLLDGVPLHDAYSGVIDWQRVPLDTLQRVEVVRGGNASLFGTFALGGTINLITRPASQDVATADLSYGSFQTSRTSLLVEHAVSPKLALRTTYHRSNSAGFDRVPFPGPVDIPAPVGTSITGLRADYAPSETTRGFVNAGFGKFNVSEGTRVSYVNSDELNVSTGLDHADERLGLISTQVFYQKERQHLANSSLIGNRMSEYLSQVSRIPSDGSGGSLEWSRSLNGSVRSFSLGADVREVAASEARHTFNSSGVDVQQNRVAGRQRFGGVFAQASWQPATRVEVLGSARLDLYRNENGSNAIVGGVRTDYPASSSRQFDPRISIRYAIGDSSALRASAYRAFSAPTLRDLYRSNRSGNSLILGNPDLKPETLTGGEIGWEWVGSLGRIEMDLYRSTIAALESRTTVPGQPPNVYHFVNLGKGRSQGAETTATLVLSPRWSLDAAYAFADSTVIEDPDPALIGKWIRDVPRNAGSISVRYRGHRGLKADLRARSQGRSYADAQNVAFSPAHRIVDLSFSQRVRPWADAYVVAENLFNELYYQALTTTSFRNGLPRSITLGIRFTNGWRRGRR